MDHHLPIGKNLQLTPLLPPITSLFYKLRKSHLSLPHRHRKPKKAWTHNKIYRLLCRSKGCNNCNSYLRDNFCSRWWKCKSLRMLWHKRRKRITNKTCFPNIQVIRSSQLVNKSTLDSRSNSRNFQFRMFSSWNRFYFVDFVFPCF